jgi:hypothetical protein
MISRTSPILADPCRRSPSPALAHPLVVLTGLVTVNSWNVAGGGGSPPSRAGSTAKSWMSDFR